MAIVIGQDAPQLEGLSFPGNENWRLSDHKLTVMVLEFSGPSWCGPCMNQAPILVQVQQEFPEPNVKFVLIGINEDNDAAFQNALDSLGITFDAIRTDNATLDNYEVSVVPTMVILDTMHRVYAVHTGVQSIEALREDIQGAIDTSPTREEKGGCLNSLLGGLLNKNKKEKKADNAKKGKSRSSDQFEKR